MKNLKDIIVEKLIINKNIKINKYHYHPKTTEELVQTVYKLIKERGTEANLNDIDTSDINDMSGVFSDNDVNRSFDGDISEWDVSNVTRMTEMFLESKFTGKNGDISNWDVRNVEDMFEMFTGSPLEDNPPKWYK